MRGLVGAGVVFGLVELLTRAGLVSATYLPPASSILRETVGLFGEGEVRTSLWSSIKACLIGLALSVLVAVPAGLVLGLSPIVHKATSTILEFLRPIPSVALIPLAIVIYGRGTEMKVALAMYACIWPVLFNTIYGIRSVDPIAADTARVFGLGKVKTAVRVHLRSASPFVYTGVKIAASIAVILVVSAELLAGGASGSGIGILMLEASSIGDQPRVYALTIVTGLIGLVLNVVFTSVERRIFPWNVQDDEAQ
jgi:NitT/TauT family transport system permease protein